LYSPKPGDSTGIAYIAYKSGTSFAAPLVSATVLHMLNVNPHLTLDQIKEILQKSGREFGEGTRCRTPGNSAYAYCKELKMLDAEAAVRMAANRR
jgi:subtilisin family serine protease